jgi:hypothetical protein
MTCVTLRWSPQLSDCKLPNPLYNTSQCEKWGHPHITVAARAVRAVTEGWFGFGILFIPKLKEIMFL